MIRQNRFRNTRACGRSDSQVIIDLVRNANPGKIFTFDELTTVLAEGSERPWDLDGIRAATSRATFRLSRETQRALISVRGVGYKVAQASEHTMVANDRKRKADRQLSRGLAVLQNVRWEEMDENQRNAHQGQLMMLSAIVSQQKSFERRMVRVEDAIKKGLRPAE